MTTTNRTDGDTQGGARVIGPRERLAILGLWTCFGLLESTKAYVTMPMRARGAGFGYALLGNMPWWIAWALLTPLIFIVAYRFRLDRRPVAGALAVHAVASVVAALAHLVPVMSLYYYTHARHAPNIGPLPVQMGNWLNTYGLFGMLTYWAVVGAYYALEFHRRMRATEQEAASLKLQAAELRALTHEARLHALRMELNPHFLYNALNAISGLVRRADRDAAVGMLARLGDLLRVTLNSNAAEEVPLERELECLELYLEIERVRFADRLFTEIDVPADLGDALVPSLILQPIVENAVRHGIAPVPGPGTIRIRARREGADVQLVVADTGAGWDTRRNGQREGVGLTNTRARLAQLYGDAAGLRAGPGPDGGTRVVLTLPYHADPPARERAPEPVRAAIEIS
jgi:two-component system, LytTR family, sensor kinase